MKSIRTKIMVIIGGICLLIMIASSIITVTTTNKTVISDQNAISGLSSQTVANEVDKSLETYISMTKTLAKDYTIRALLAKADSRDTFTALPEFPVVHSTLEESTNIDSESILSVYIASGLTDVAFDGGDWIGDPGYDAKTRDFWPTDKALEDGYLITEPYQDADTGSMVVTVSSPVFDFKGNLIGITGIDVTIDKLSAKVVNQQTQYDPEKSELFLIDGAGTVLASENKDNLLKNIGDIGFSDAMVKEITEPAGKIVDFDYEGKHVYASVTQAGNVNWKTMLAVEKGEYLDAVDSMKKTLIIIYVIAILILIVVMLVVTASIVAPLRKLNAITQQLAAGNLDTEVDVVSSDETGQLAESMRALVGRLSEYIDYIDEVSAALDRFATGHLDINLTQSYDGDFAKIKTSLLEVSRVFKDTIGQIVETSQRVASGSGEIANAAQMLAQGATNQASTTEELTATINELSERVTKNADHAKNASQQAKQVGGTADQSNEQMKEMIEAIAEINEKSSEIGKIIKTIEDIAFQTNILALNAAVEAARAGEAGKGFAVVADEVRNLASKSAEAAKDTTHLIEETIKAVENGTEIANKTGEMLGEVIEGVSQTVGLIQEISDASSSQADALKQTLDGVEEISTVTQTNAATAEESSAASDELSKQANALQGVASQFKL